jgi:hypothetical protein
MKMEKLDFHDQLMIQRAASMAGEPVQPIVIPPRNLPRARIRNTSTDSQNSLKLSNLGHETKQRSHHETKESDHDYQKLDVKKLAPLQQYESLRSKSQHDEETAENQHASASSTGQESHYEPLRLKSVNKPSEYQELKIIRT